VDKMRLRLYNILQIFTFNKIKKKKKRKKKKEKATVSQPQNEGKCPKKFTQLSQSPQ